MPFDHGPWTTCLVSCSRHRTPKLGGPPVGPCESWRRRGNRPSPFRKLLGIFLEEPLDEVPHPRYNGDVMGVPCPGPQDLGPRRSIYDPDRPVSEWCGPCARSLYLVPGNTHGHLQDAFRRIILGSLLQCPLRPRTFGRGYGPRPGSMVPDLKDHTMPRTRLPGPGTRPNAKVPGGGFNGGSTGLGSLFSMAEDPDQGPRDRTHPRTDRPAAQYPWMQGADLDLFGKGIRRLGPVPLQEAGLNGAFAGPRAQGLQTALGALLERRKRRYPSFDGSSEVQRITSLMALGQ